MLLSIVRTNILKRNGFIKTYLTSVSQTLLVKPDVVGVAVLLAEVCEGIFTARGLVVGVAVGFDERDRLPHIFCPRDRSDVRLGIIVLSRLSLAVQGENAFYS